MSLDNFILNCEKENKQLVKDIEHYKNKSERLLQEKENLIKYLEDFISKTDYEINILGNYPYLVRSNIYKDLLEKIRSGKYEDK